MWALISIRIIFCCYISNCRNSSNDSSPCAPGTGSCSSYSQSCLLSHGVGYSHALAKTYQPGCDRVSVILTTIFRQVGSLVFLLPFYRWRMVDRRGLFWIIFCKVRRSYWRDLLPCENTNGFSFCDRRWGWLPFSNEIFDVWMDWVMTHTYATGTQFCPSV